MHAHVNEYEMLTTEVPEICLKLDLCQPNALLVMPCLYAGQTLFAYLLVLPASLFQYMYMLKSVCVFAYMYWFAIG